MQNISPFFRSPFSDITGGMVSSQFFDRCGRQEMELMDCLEAYGLDRGIRKCKDLIEEYRECQTLNKQYLRFVALRKERDRQIACGLEKDKRYVSPRIDSY